MQEELVKILSKYSVDCIACAICVFLVLLIIRKRCPLPEKLNKLLPFCLTFAVYCVAAAFGSVSTDVIISKSLSAGGLATVLYAFVGGFANRDDDELKKLLKTVLDALVGDDSADLLAEKIFNDLSSAPTDEDGLKTVRISDLIKANLPDDADIDQVQFVSAVFVRAFNKLKAKTKN